MTCSSIDDMCIYIYIYIGKQIFSFYTNKCDFECCYFWQLFAITFSYTITITFVTITILYCASQRASV